MSLIIFGLSVGTILFHAKQKAFRINMEGNFSVEKTFCISLVETFCCSFFFPELFIR